MGIAWLNFTNMVCGGPPCQLSLHGADVALADDADMAFSDAGVACAACQLVSHDADVALMVLLCFVFCGIGTAVSMGTCADAVLSWSLEGHCRGVFNLVRTRYLG